MIARVLIIAAVAAVGVFLWWRYRPDPLLRVPREWKLRASREPDFRRALQLRRSIARLLATGRAGPAEGMLDEIDAVIRRLYSMSEVKQHLSEVVTDEPGAKEQLGAEIARIESEVADALALLEESRKVVLQLVGAEVNVEVNAMRGALRERSENLEVLVEAHQQVSEMLQAEEA